MTSKERAALKTQAMQLDSIFQIGKSSLTPQMVEAVKDALRARELVKISVLKNCLDDPREIAEVLSERTGSEVVQVIGKKIILYKKNYEREEKRKRAAKRKAEMAKSSHHNKNEKGAIANHSVRKRKGKATEKQESAKSRTGHAGEEKRWKWSDR